jgi:hypothetical protein
MTTALKDQFGRSIEYLRISVTDRCNPLPVLLPAEGLPWLPKAEILSYEEIAAVVRRSRRSDCGAFASQAVNRPFAQISKSSSDSFVQYRRSKTSRCRQTAHDCRTRACASRCGARSHQHERGQPAVGSHREDPRRNLRFDPVRRQLSPPSAKALARSRSPSS